MSQFNGQLFRGRLFAGRLFRGPGAAEAQPPIGVRPGGRRARVVPIWRDEFAAIRNAEDDMILFTISGLIASGVIH